MLEGSAFNVPAAGGHRGAARRAVIIAARCGRQGVALDGAGRARREARDTGSDRARLDWDPLGGGRVDRLRRVLRWLSLTVVQHGIWPLVLLLGGGPALPVAHLPWGWWLARAVGPALAALLALAYLGWRLPGPMLGRSGSVAEGAGATWAAQARMLIVGVAVLVAVARLAAGPADAAAKVLLFGVADVAAYQFVNLGVATRGARDPRDAAMVGVGLFALSWGLQQAVAAMLGAPLAALPVAFAAGLATGAAIGALVLGIRQWPGGWLTGFAAQWLLVWGIAAFVR